MKKIIVFLLCACFLFVCNMQVFALSTSNPLTLTKYSSEKSNWCYAACAKMVGNYFGNYYTQTQIVTHVKGSSTNNYGATYAQQLKALEYVLNGDYSVTQYGVPTYVVITNHVANRHYPVYCVIQWENDSGQHAQLITGTDGTSVYLVNPSNLNEWVKYSDLKNGTSLMSGTGYICATYRFDAN